MSLLLVPGLFALLIFAALRLSRSSSLQGQDNEVAVDAINKILPQTQCGKCGYAGCRPYAQAIVNGEADINHCPPGGEPTRRAIARLLGRDAPEEQQLPSPVNLVALIDENVCIGCVKCLHACPVDAILGAPKKLHTVITQECTGCGLCIAPCPVDCISLVPVRVKTREWVWSKPDPSVRLRG